MADLAGISRSEQDFADIVSWLEHMERKKYEQNIAFSKQELDAFSECAEFVKFLPTNDGKFSQKDKEFNEKCEKISLFLHKIGAETFSQKQIDEQKIGELEISAKDSEIFEEINNFIENLESETGVSDLKNEELFNYECGEISEFLNALGCCDAISEKQKFAAILTWLSANELAYGNGNSKSNVFSKSAISLKSFPNAEYPLDLYGFSLSPKSPKMDSKKSFDDAMFDEQCAEIAREIDFENYFNDLSNNLNGSGLKSPLSASSSSSSFVKVSDDGVGEGEWMRY